MVEREREREEKNEIKTHTINYYPSLTFSIFSLFYATHTHNALGFFVYLFLNNSMAKYLQRNTRKKNHRYVILFQRDTKEKNQKFIARITQIEEEQ